MGPYQGSPKPVGQCHAPFGPITGITSYPAGRIWDSQAEATCWTLLAYSQRSNSRSSSQSQERSREIQFGAEQASFHGRRACRAEAQLCRRRRRRPRSPGADRHGVASASIGRTEVCCLGTPSTSAIAKGALVARLRRRKARGDTRLNQGGSVCVLPTAWRQGSPRGTDGSIFCSERVGRVQPCVQSTCPRLARGRQVTFLSVTSRDISVSFYLQLFDPTGSCLDFGFQRLNLGPCLWITDSPLPDPGSPFWSLYSVSSGIDTLKAAYHGPFRLLQGAKDAHRWLGGAHLHNFSTSAILALDHIGPAVILGMTQSLAALLY